MEFIFKGFSKAIFSDAPALNLVPRDLGEDMISASYDSDVVARIRTAVGTIGSPELFAEVSITVNILKTSPQYEVYKSRIRSNTVIDGELTVYDDVNSSYTFSKLTVKPTGFTGSGKDASVQYIVQGNYAVNTDLIAQITA